MLLPLMSSFSGSRPRQFPEFRELRFRGINKFPEIKQEEEEKIDYFHYLLAKFNREAEMSLLII